MAAAYDVEGQRNDIPMKRINPAKARWGVAKLSRERYGWNAPGRVEPQPSLQRSCPCDNLRW